MRIDGIADETHILTWKECRKNSIDRTAMLRRQASIRASDLKNHLISHLFTWWELIPARPTVLYTIRSAIGLLGIAGELEGIKHARIAGLLVYFMFPSEHVLSLIFILRYISS